jgi:hypothetical protein
MADANASALNSSPDPLRTGLDTISNRLLNINGREQMTLKEYFYLRASELSIDEVATSNYFEHFRKVFSSSRGSVKEKTVDSYLAGQLRVLKGITESELTPTGVSINIDDTLKELYIPFDVESHAEDAILMESIIYFDKLGWTIKSIPGTFVGSSKDSWKTFLSGYFAELYSTQKVSNILLQKDKPFQNGRACARYEILKALVPAETQSYIRNIDIDIIGKSKKEPGRLKSTISSNIIEKERDNVLHILKVAAKAATASNKDFEFSKFLVSYEDLIAKHKRSKKSIKTI